MIEIDGLLYPDYIKEWREWRIKETIRKNGFYISAAATKSIEKAMRSVSKAALRIGK